MNSAIDITFNVEEVMPCEQQPINASLRELSQIDFSDVVIKTTNVNKIVSWKTVLSKK